ncbi:MAG: DDE-type integrase/transposase/recombinase [Halioglobus sp.]
MVVSQRIVRGSQNRTPNQGRKRFSSAHSTTQYENNRAEHYHEATRVRERGMRKFKSVSQAQRFLGAHAAVSNLFNLSRHLVRAQHYRDLRVSAFNKWGRAVA